MRAVIDTNVFLSAWLGGRTRAVLDALLARRFELLISTSLLGELAYVLSRSEWQRLLGAHRVRELLAVVREAAVIVHPSQPVTACRDPEDNALLECGIAGRADVLVTGDRDLLTLHPFHSLDILSPSDFLRRLAG